MGTPGQTYFAAILAEAGFDLEHQLLGTNVRGAAIARAEMGRILVTLVDPGAAAADLDEHRGWDLPLHEARTVGTVVGDMLRIVERLPDAAVAATSLRESPAAAATGAGTGPPPFVLELVSRVAAEHAAGATVGRLHPSLVFVDPANASLAGVAQRPLRAARAAKVPDAVPPILDATFLSPAEYRGEPADAADDVFRLATTLWHWRHGADPFEDLPRTTRIPLLAGYLEPPDTIGDDLDQALWAAFASDPGRRPTAASLHAALRSAARW